MIASVETDVFALDLAPATKLGRDSLFLSPAYRFLSPDRMTALLLYFSLDSLNQVSCFFYEWSHFLFVGLVNQIVVAFFPEVL